jgi:hypothetical protein
MWIKKKHMKLVEEEEGEDFFLLGVGEAKF